MSAARECDGCAGRGCDECSQTGDVTTDMDDLVTGRCSCENPEQWHESTCPVHGGEVAALIASVLRPPTPEGGERAG